MYWDKKLLYRFCTPSTAASTFPLASTTLRSCLIHQEVGLAVKKKKERGRAHTCSQKIRRRATARTAYRCYVTLYLTPPSSEEETETSRGPFRLGIKSTEKRNASAVSFLRISAVKTILPVASLVAQPRKLLSVNL